MKQFKTWFRYNNKNSYSIAALMPLVEAGIAREPKDGIMLYSFASAQAEEVYSEVSAALRWMQSTSPAALTPLLCPRRCWSTSTSS